MRFSIDEEGTAAEQHSRRRRKAYPAACGLSAERTLRDGTMRTVEDDDVLGLGEVAAQKIHGVRVTPADASERLARLAQQAVRQAGGAALRLQAGVAVDAIEPDAVLEELEKARSQLLRARRAKADGVGDGGPNSNPVVRAARRKIEHVAGFQHPFARRPKATQYAQWRVTDQRQIALAAYLPVPGAFALHEEYVVAVEVRPDPSAVRRIACHDIVEARIGDKGEPARQILNRSDSTVHPLNQQSPASAGQSRQLARGERAVAHAPAVAVARHEPRFQVVAARKLENRFAP